MQFPCESCKTLLQIADDRVRGKRLLVRCKRCGARMQIADPVLAGSGGGNAAGGRPAPAARQSPPARTQPERAAGLDSDDQDTLAMDAELLERAVRASKDDRAAATFAIPVGGQDDEETSSPDAPAWFAILAGKQAGPLTHEQIAHQVEEGAVGPRTYLWRDGMEAWARAKDVPEVAQMFAPPPQQQQPAADRGAAAPRPAQPAAQQARSAPTEASGAGGAQGDVVPPADAGAAGFDAAVRDLARWASAELSKSGDAPPASEAAGSAAPPGRLFAPAEHDRTAFWVAAAIIAALVACGVAAAVLLSGGAAPPSEPRIDPEPGEQHAHRLAPSPRNQLAPAPPGAGLHFDVRVLVWRAE